MNFPISFEKSQSLITQDLVIFVDPNYSFDYLLPFFLEKFRLHTSARIEASDFKAIFYLLIYMRLIGSQNQHLSQIVYNFLNTIRIPKGLQKIVHFLPLNGLFYNYKNNVLTFKLSQSLVEEIEARIKDHSYFMKASNLSRHLVGNKNALCEKYDDKLMNSMPQTFQMSSYITVGDNIQRPSDQSSLALRCGSKSPDFNVGIALSFVLCLSAKECQNLDRLFGITWTCEMSDLSFNLNVRKAFSGLLSGIDNEPGSHNTKGLTTGYSESDTIINSKRTDNNLKSNVSNLMKTVMNRDDKTISRIVASAVIETLRLLNLNEGTSHELVRA